MTYGSAAVVEVQLKYNDLANQFNKVDLIKLAKGRLITDKNLLFYYKFGNNDTKKSYVTSDVIDSDTCSLSSNHQNLCKPVYKEILTISSDSKISYFDHHQESCHALELLGSTTGTTVTTI